MVTIPLSLVGTLAFMLVMGYSLNTFSLLAIVLSVGLVVDDAIVDVENVQRHIARGLDPMTAAFVGRSEEHTSELQSLMRISYAVFCLKKQTIQLHIHTPNLFYSKPHTSQTPHS